MEEASPRDRFLESLGRCIDSGDFIATFYDRFLAADPEIREKFRDTDFDRQKRMLERSLLLSAGATTGDADALRELRERARTHDRNHLDIPPRLYELWRSSMTETAREFDHEWSPQIEDAWNRILGHIIRHMTMHY